MNGTWSIFCLISGIVYWNCTFALLDGVGLVAIRSILLKHVSKTITNGTFILWSCFIYVSGNNFSSIALCMKVWILVSIIALLYDVDFNFLLNTWTILYVIYLSQSFWLTIYPKRLFLNVFTSYCSWMIFITNFYRTLL